MNLNDAKHIQICLQCSCSCCCSINGAVRKSTQNIEDHWSLNMYHWLSVQGPECKSIGVSRPLIRSITRLNLKLAAGRMLHARFYKPDELEQLCEKYKQQSWYKRISWSRLHFDNLMLLSDEELQRWVRASFGTMTASQTNDTMADFITEVVMLCLDINAHSFTSDATKKALSLGNHLRAGTLSTISDEDLRLACKVASGCLKSHPAIHGLLLAVLERSSRDERGVRTMRSLNNFTDREKQLYQDFAVWCFLRDLTCHLSCVIMRAFVLTTKWCMIFLQIITV